MQIEDNVTEQKLRVKPGGDVSTFLDLDGRSEVNFGGCECLANICEDRLMILDFLGDDNLVKRD